MKPIQLCGLGNALVDIFLELSEPEFASLGYERSTMVLVDLPEQRSLLERYQKHEPKLVSGGSVANSVIAFSQLGGQAAFIGCVGDDRYGLFYASEFEDLGIAIGNPIIVNEATGTSVCIVTPDAERTMRTCLAVASHLSARHVDEERIKNSEWLFLEGYVFANPETGQTAIREAVRLARQHKTKIAITCSDAFVPQVFGEPLNAALDHAEPPLLQRARSVRRHGGQRRPKRPSRNSRNACPPPWSPAARTARTFATADVETHVAGVCLRAQGSDRRRRHVRRVVSLRDHARRAAGTGRACRRISCRMKVITQVGARLHQGTRQFWDECLAAVQD